jgi:ABC-type multidrug transport system fused ATPase/permease subunit
MTAVLEDHALPTATPREARARMVRLLRARWKGVLGAALLTSGATAAALAGPALVGVVVDAVANGRADAARIIDRAALGYAVLALLAAALRYWGGVRAAVVGEGALAEMRTEVFDHALGVPVDLVERAGTGDLVSRVTSDVSVLADAVRRSIPIAVFAVLEVTFTLGALLLLDPRLAAIAFVTATPIAVLAARWYFRRAHGLYRRERERHALLAAGLHESYQGSPVLAGYRAGPRTRLGLAGRGRSTLDAELTTTTARNRMRPAVSVAQAISLVAVMAAGAAMVDAGSLEIGTLSAAALYLIQLFSPVGNLLEQSDELQRSTASFARLVGVTQLPFDHNDQVAVAGRSTPASDGADAIGTLGVDVSDVVFGYEPSTRVLDGISLTVAPGERLAVVGPSGAGKTTLGKVVAGLLHPAHGHATIGGSAVDRLEPHARSRLVAMVAQEVHVFANTVAENVRLGRPGATDDDVRVALAAVDALAWADGLPDGIHTRVGDAHHHVSTTRAQQLALARLVCLDPAVVVLDEATAELDPVAAARTERHLDAALGRRTVISIVHRLDVAERADRVLVLDRGVVVACGRHADLVADAGSPYADLWRAWSASRRENTDGDFPRTS